MSSGCANLNAPRQRAVRVGRSSTWTHDHAWLANAGSGITDFFARVGNLARVNTGELCVGQTCVTEPELRELLDLLSEIAAAAGAPDQGIGSGAPAVSPAGGTNGPPIITINGDNLATSSPEVPAPAITLPANDNQAEPVVDERAEPTADEPAPMPELKASNDNSPFVELPTTGTK